MIARCSARRTVARAALLALVVVTGLGAQACSARPQDCARPDVRCAGLVTGFGSLHEGISQQSWLALQDARAAGVLDRVDSIETVDSRDRAANIADFGDAGYDIIVTVGAGIADETVSAAKKYPDVYFIGVQQSLDRGAAPGNLAALVFHEEESGFLAGAAAALTTRTRHVAAVCEADFIDSIHRYCEGFQAGARYVDPEIRVAVTYRSGPQELLFRDGEWGRAAAIQELAEGADVVFAVGEETAEAALAAAATGGALVIGAETDVYAGLPEIRPQLVTSATLDFRSGLLTLLRETVEGRFPAGDYQGRVGLAPFHDFEARMAPDSMKKLQGIAADLESGAIHIDISR